MERRGTRWLAYRRNVEGPAASQGAGAVSRSVWRQRGRAPELKRTTGPYDIKECRAQQDLARMCNRSLENTSCMIKTKIYALRKKSRFLRRFGLVSRVHQVAPYHMKLNENGAAPRVCYHRVPCDTLLRQNKTLGFCLRMLPAEGNFFSYKLSKYEVLGPL